MQTSTSWWISRPVANRNGGSPGRGSSRSSSKRTVPLGRITRRATGLSVRVAQFARLAESEIRQVYWGGLVHDIGELDVPAPILEQPGPLATIERKTVDLHPSIGSRWLAGTPGLSSLVPYARWHHERFDGKGYPDGRGGNEVPLTVA